MDCHMSPTPGKRAPEGIKSGKIYKRDGYRFQAEYTLEGVVFDNLSNRDLEKLLRIQVFTRYHEVKDYVINTYYRGKLIRSKTTKLDVDDVRETLEKLYKEIMLEAFGCLSNKDSLSDFNQSVPYISSSEESVKIEAVELYTIKKVREELKN
jgi:hypothetical protein